jgi:hypothetical protein
VKLINCGTKKSITDFLVELKRNLQTTNKVAVFTRFGLLSQYCAHSKCHSRSISVRITDKHSGRIPIVIEECQ